MYEHLRAVSARSAIALVDAFMEDTRWLTKGRTYRLYELQGGDVIFKSDYVPDHFIPRKELFRWFKVDPWVRYIDSVPIPKWVTYDNLLMVHDIISARDKPQQPGYIATIVVEGAPHHSGAVNAALQSPCCVFAFESTNQLEWCLVAVKELRMKVYAVRPEYVYTEEATAAQQAIVDELGLTFGPLRTVFCSADQALALLAKGFCGTYCNHDAIQLVYDTSRN